jgi:RNA recognition motif-containing protein
MALTAEREAYLRLAAHSMERSEQIAPHFNFRSPKAYGGYVPPQSHSAVYDQPRQPYINGHHTITNNGLSPSSPSSYQNQQHLSDTNLYIKNLPPEYSDQDLAKLVEGCGKVKSMKAIIDKQTNKCKGFGFIDFESNEDAQLAIAQLQKKGFTAQLAKSSQQQEQDTTNLYFANLDPQMTEQDLRQALSQYGTVVSVRILRDQQKQSRGVGFARMNDKEQCQAIINRFHNQSFPDFSDKHVHVKFADASNKNKKLYKTGLDDMKSGHPLYPMDQTVSYQSQAVVFPQWSPMQAASILSQQAPSQQQQAPPPTLVSGPPQHPHHPAHHQMYAQAQQLRPPLGVFNPAMQSYMQLSHGPGHETGAAFVLPMQQLQQLQLTNGHPGAFCLVNPQHPHAHPHATALYMQAPQQTAAAQPQSQLQQSAPPPPPQHDPSLVVSQDLS